MAHSFSEIHAKYEDVFNVTPMIGFFLQMSDFKLNKTGYDVSVGFHPTELVQISTPNGSEYAYLHPLRTFTFASSTPFNIFNINTLLSSHIQALTIKTNCDENIKLSFKLEKRARTNLRPTFSSQFIYPKFTFIMQFQTADYQNITTSDLTFSLFDKFGFQFVQRRRNDTNNFGYAFLSCFDFSKTSVALSLLHENDYLLILRSLTKVKDNVRAGVKLSINQRLFSAFTVGYKIKINKYLIHSSIDTNGFVKSYFDREVNDNFHFIMSTSLNHPERSYHFGVGLSWSNKENTDN